MEHAINPKYIKTEDGKDVVILSLQDFNELLEDLDDLAAVAERRDEKTFTHQEVMARLKADGLL